MPTESGTFKPFSGTVKEETIDFDGNQNTVNTSVNFAKGSWERVSARTPRFWKLSREGKLPMNGFSYEKTEKFLPSTTINHVVIRKSDGKVSSTVTQGYVDVGFAQPSISSETKDALNADAVNRVLSRVKDNDFNLGIAIAEGHRSVDLIVESTKTIAQAALQAKRGNLIGAADTLGIRSPGRKRRNRSVAQDWLALQYGVKPIMNDIYNASEYIRKQSNWMPRNRVIAVAKSTENYSNITEEYFTRVFDEWTADYTVKYVLYFIPNVGDTPFTTLGLTNPLPILWEVTGFSFVYDWIQPLGSYLEVLDATSGCVFEKGCKTTFFRGRSTRRVSGKNVDEPDNVHQYDAGYSGKLEVVECIRQPLTGFPVPLIPSVRKPFTSVTRMLNAIALLATAVGK